jgi:hypothetical protein
MWCDCLMQNWRKSGMPASYGIAHSRKGAYLVAGLAGQGVEIFHTFAARAHAHLRRGLLSREAKPIPRPIGCTSRPRSTCSALEKWWKVSTILTPSKTKETFLNLETQGLPTDRDRRHTAGDGTVYLPQMLRTRLSATAV